MKTKEDFIQKIDKYTEKGYLYNQEWEEISEQATDVNRTLINGHKVNLDKIIRNKFKIRDRDSEDINKLMRNEGFVRKDSFFDDDGIGENTKNHKRLMNGNLFVIDNEIIFENELEIHKTATYFNKKSTLNNKKVLIKVLKQEHTKDRDKILSFYESYEKVKNIDHPNVISGVDKWIDNTGLFYAIEYIEGVTLSHLLKNDKLNEIDEINHITHGILKGLEYLHKNDIFLGNLNPDNIVINEKGQVIITDMNLHGYEGEIKKAIDYVSDNNFIAPEQLKEGTTAQSDIYSFGKIVSLLTTEQTEDIFKIKNSFAPELFEIALKSTKHKASERYASATEILKGRKNLSFKKITTEIGKNINYIYIALSGLLLLALSNKIIAILGTNYVVSKQIITILGIFALIFSLMIITFNIVLKDDNDLP